MGYPAVLILLRVCGTFKEQCLKVAVTFSTGDGQSVPMGLSRAKKVSGGERPYSQDESWLLTGRFFLSAGTRALLSEPQRIPAVL